MPTQTSSTIDHVIGADGTATIRVPSGGVTVQGVDGETVRLSSPSGRDLHEDYRIETRDGDIELSARDDRGGVFGLFSIRRFEPVHAEVPRGANVRLETASGGVHVDGLRGEQSYRAASGSIKLTDVSGDITVDHVSGAVKIRGTGPVRLVARTVSGDVNASAPSFEKFQGRTMSGSVGLAGRLVGDGPFSIESVSGDVSLELDGPAHIEGTSVAGRIHTDLPHRSGGSPGRRTVEIGDAGPRVSFRTVSGDLRVSGPKNTTTEPSDAAVPAPGLPDAAPADPGTATAVDALAARRLAILRDLEEGRIEISEATDRLAEIDAEEERARPQTRTFGIGPLHAELRWDHRA
jgi:DUF4097 and DUF4098 domain-containing protein YvlB